MLTIVFALTTILCAVLFFYEWTLRLAADEACTKYQRRWEASLLDRNAEESLIYEWANRDLIPKWEECYPHVKHMPEVRKYNEWATFCANYPSREQLLTELELNAMGAA